MRSEGENVLAGLVALIESAADDGETADRPASGRVLEKAGFSNVGQEDDDHEGVRIRVNRWEFTPHP